MSENKLDEIQYDIVNNPVTGIPEQAPLQKKTRPPAVEFSPFETDDNAHHGMLEIKGGEYYYRLPSLELQKYIDTLDDRAAAALGITIDEFKAGEKAKSIPNAGKIVQAVREEMWARVIDECLVAWSYEVPCDAEHKAKLIKSVRREIAINIITDSDYGVSEINFFRELDLASSLTK